MNILYLFVVYTIATTELGILFDHTYKLQYIDTSEILYYSSISRFEVCRPKFLCIYI